MILGFGNIVGFIIRVRWGWLGWNVYIGSVEEKGSRRGYIYVKI